MNNNDKSERFKKGFNHGYALAQAGIELPKMEFKGKDDLALHGDYVQGLRAGLLELSKEVAQHKSIERLKTIRNERNVDSKNKGLSR